MENKDLEAEALTGTDDGARAGASTAYEAIRFFR
jgi:hypothetical protein